MNSSLASQLKAIKSIIQADTEPSKRPFTRPSILFTLKEAADLDIESIYELWLKVTRVKKSIENCWVRKRILVSTLLISSYLRLLSGFIQFRASLETLEYLIRRSYKIHVYNLEDVVLCALPYHDTHAFVRIAQLLQTGNTKWKFLDGVKHSGAPPPRSVIVQKCIRDMQVLETICDYMLENLKEEYMVLLAETIPFLVLSPLLNLWLKVSSNRWKR